MPGWFSSWLVSPALFWAGLAAISIPIIIHLLNRRRFKIVEWAAMSFLLDAEKKNRRRVRLENLLLLLLRCLAMLLIGMILARPFLDPQMLQGVLQNPQFERVVVLDDSLSMQLQTGNEDALGRGLGQVEQLLQKFVGNNSEDSLTVFLASRPDEPLFSNEPVTGETLDALGSRLNELEPVDVVARFDEVLQTVDRYLHAEQQNVSRAVYIFSDFRQHDWRRPGDEENPNAPNQLIKSIADIATDCVLVDVGTTHESNVTIESITPRETLITGVANQFDVAVRNHSAQELRGLKLRLRVGETLPIERSLDSLPAGEVETVTFDYVFSSAGDEELMELDMTRRLEQNLRSFPVQAELVGDAGGQDQLLADSRGYYAARVIRGVPVLLVDGDPSADDVRAETHFLERALSPPGETFSGVLVDTKTDIEFESLPIADYRVIALCNVREISADRVALLKEWVKNGGGLVLMPGDQVVAELYNDLFYEEGMGLSPVKLTEIQGDVDEQTWAYFEVEEKPHPVFEIFAGQDNPFLNSVKVFSWWGAELADVDEPASEEDSATTTANAAEDADDATQAATGDEAEATDESSDEPADAAETDGSGGPSAPVVMLELNDPGQTPVVSERRLGSGRVVAFTIPADRQWTDWPDNPSYVIAFQELVKYVAGNLVESTSLEVGSEIRYPIDLAQYRRSVQVTDPEGDTFTLDATPVDPDAAEEDQSLWQIELNKTQQRGFYDFQLTRTDGSTQTLSYAANIDPLEGDLSRFRLDDAGRGFFGDKAQFISGGDVVAGTGDANQSEIWFLLLFLLGGALMLEQTLAWWFGRGR